MASPSELSLECKPQSYSMLLKSFGDQQATWAADPSQKLEDFLAQLEEEQLKIDAFKRELPLCMQLLTNAVEASRQQLQAYKANQGSSPVLEEFIPLKNSASEGTEKASNNISDKANWMTSAQLWSQASDGTKQQATVTSSPKDTENIGFNISPKLALVDNNKLRNGGGAFIPFSKDGINSSPNPNFRALPELALAPNEKEMEDKKYNGSTENGIQCPRRDINNNNSNKGGNIINGMAIEDVKPLGNSPERQVMTTSANANSTSATNNQTHRKARRCWSPDLHRRFVNALQMLGGSQVATPKQIRELMKVDGLTNDEVKSHLQKYRLHTRRPSPSPQATGGPAPQLVVLGGIWVPPEYAAAAAHGSTTALYGAHPASHAPPHYCAPAVPGQEFYAAAAATSGQAQPPPHHHHLHHQLHVYKAASQVQSSPESGMRAAGDLRSESIEDGKSESSSGENGGGGERRGLSNLRDENEESNGSEITLKF